MARGTASPVPCEQGGFFLELQESRVSRPQAEEQVLTTLVGGLHGLRGQAELAHEGPQLPRGQGRAEHAQGLQGRARLP